MIPEYLSLDIPQSDKPRLLIVVGGFAGLELDRIQEQTGNTGQLGMELFHL